MRAARFFISSAAMILFFTGAVKIVSAASGGRTVEVFDPVFGLRLKALFWIVGGLEILVATACIIVKEERKTLKYIGCLSLAFVLYRLGLIWIGHRRYVIALAIWLSFGNFPPLWRMR